jgi:hypothetical protein
VPVVETGAAWPELHSIALWKCLEPYPLIDPPSAETNLPHNVCNRNPTMVELSYKGKLLLERGAVAAWNRRGWLLFRDRCSHPVSPRRPALLAELLFQQLA